MLASSADERSRVFSKRHKQKIEEALSKESETYDALKDRMDYLNSSFSIYQDLKYGLMSLLLYFAYLACILSTFINI